MATNPRIPEPHSHAKIHEEDSKKRHFPVPVVIIIVAAAILAALAWYLPRTPVARPQPAGAVVPAQPTGNQIQLTNINLSKSPVGDQVYINAILHNAGNTAINGVMVNVSFPGANGVTAGTVQAPVNALTGSQNAVSESLLSAPIQPGADQPVRIAVNAPQGWNNQLPALEVATVTAVGTGQPGANAQKSGTNVNTNAPSVPTSPAQPQQ
jgi:hypothetical protein